MKKNLLMAGVACCLTLGASMNAHAGYLSDMYHEMRPYVGADYVFSHVKFGNPATHMKKNYHSGMVNLGARMYENLGLEVFYQQSLYEAMVHQSLSDIFQQRLEHGNSHGIQFLSVIL